MSLHRAFMRLRTGGAACANRSRFGCCTSRYAKAYANADPTPTPEPTPEPITDVLYDDGTINIRYARYYEGGYILRADSKMSDPVLLLTGPVEIDEAGELSYSKTAALNGTEYYCEMFSLKGGYVTIPAAGSAGFILLVYCDDGTLYQNSEPESLDLQFAGIRASGEGFTKDDLVFDSGKIHVDFTKTASARDIRQQRRRDALAAGEYAGVYFTGEDFAGNAIDETELTKNKLTVVNFWATWCKPCTSEIPAFSKVAQKYAEQGVGFLGVQTDSDLAAAKAIWTERAVAYPSILSDGDFYDLQLDMENIPTTILYDRYGNQIGPAHEGSMTEGRLSALLDETLATLPESTPPPVTKPTTTRGENSVTYEKPDGVKATVAWKGRNMTVTLNDPELRDYYIINRPSTGECEYSWGVDFGDETTTFNVGTKQWKPFPGTPRAVPPTGMTQNDLSIKDGGLLFRNWETRIENRWDTNDLDVYLAVKIQA